MKHAEALKILGLNADTTEQKIQEAYKKKALELHPDKFAGEPIEVIKQKEEEFKQLCNAKEELLTKDDNTKFNNANSDTFNEQDFFKKYANLKKSFLFPEGVIGDSTCYFSTSDCNGFVKRTATNGYFRFVECTAMNEYFSLVVSHKNLKETKLKFEESNFTNDNKINLYNSIYDGLVFISNLNRTHLIKDDLDKITNPKELATKLHNIGYNTCIKQRNISMAVSASFGVITIISAGSIAACILFIPGLNVLAIVGIATGLGLVATLSATTFVGTGIYASYKNSKSKAPKEKLKELSTISENPTDEPSSDKSKDSTKQKK